VTGVALPPSLCPICAPLRPESRDLLSEGAQAIVACTRCGLVRLSPPLDAHGVTAIVEEGHYHYGGEIDWASDYTWAELLRTSAVRNAIADHRRLLAALSRWGGGYTEMPRVYDIGCSEGFSLALGQKEGWKCSGNDLSPVRRAFGRRNLGVDFTLGTFSEVPAQPLDVVVMRHVLEHLRTPESELALVHSRLVPGGLLLVEVPNFGAPSLRFKTWRQRVGLRRGSLAFLGVPEHQWQFTARTLRLLLVKAGFEVLEVATTSRHLNHTAPTRIFLRATVHRLRLGSYLTVVARKPMS